MNKRTARKPGAAKQSGDPAISGAMRAATKYIQQGYESAQRRRRTEGWLPTAGSANAEIVPALHVLRNQSRDLMRSNPYAKKALRTLISNHIGPGVLLKTEHQEEFDRWTLRCDYDAQLDFYGLQALIWRAVLESGECLVRFISATADGVNVPLLLQVLEPDYLDSTRTGPLAGGNYLIAGVEFDSQGRRVAYWLFDQHPGEMGLLPRGLMSRRVGAEDILHIYQKERPGQVRGVPEFYAAIMAARDAADYTDAEIVRKKTEACFSVFVHTADEARTLGTSATDADGNRTEKLAPGMIQYLRDGEQVSFGTPRAVLGYAEIMRDMRRAIAAGAGVTYEQLSGDLSEVNFTSLRAGLLEFRSQCDMVQWLTIVPMLLRPIYDRWVSVALAAGLIRDIGEPAEYTMPKRDWVTPVDDVAASKEEIKAKMSSLSDHIRRMGKDPQKVFAEIAAEQAELAALGIESDVVSKALSE